MECLYNTPQTGVQTDILHRPVQRAIMTNPLCFLPSGGIVWKCIFYGAIFFDLVFLSTTIFQLSHF